MEDLALKSVHELRVMAARQKISGRAEMKKVELIQALTTSTLEARVARLEERVESLIDRLNETSRKADRAHHLMTPMA